MLEQTRKVNNAPCIDYETFFDMKRTVRHLECLNACPEKSIQILI